MTTQPAFSSFPHCDGRVLHAPTECQYCDERKDLQALRELWKINFTGHHDAGKTTCPGEKERGLESINAWGGNRAKPTLEGWAAGLAEQLWKLDPCNLIGTTWKPLAAKAISAALKRAPVADPTYDPYL